MENPMDDIEFNSADNEPLVSPSDHHPSDAAIRRGSRNEHNDFSRQDSGWPDYHFSLENPPHVNNSLRSPTIYRSQSGDEGQHGMEGEGSNFASQSNWTLGNLSGECTPTVNFDGSVGNDTKPTIGAHPDYKEPHAIAYGQVSPTHPSVTLQGEGISIYTGSHGANWEHPGMGSEGNGFGPMSPGGSGTTPNFVNNTDVLRRDGIRKKNARFDIPPERNLKTIDLMISQASDDNLLKELKQQKRLLRNRQAALDSRQRKKQHTERLEEEKKHLNMLISQLQDQVASYKRREEEFCREKENWNAHQQHMKQYFDRSEIEREEMVKQHTNETADLRRKNAALQEQLTSLSAEVASSTQVSPRDYDFSPLSTFGMNGWRGFPSDNAFSIENRPPREVYEPVYRADAPHRDHKSEQSIPPGVLLMILLCGAWVASQNPATTKVTAPLPVMPEEVRAASVTVLSNIYKDSGVQLQGQHPVNVDTSLGGPQLSRAATFPVGDGVHDLAHPMRSGAPHFLSPTTSQSQEQAFSLTPAQFNDLSDDSPMGYPSSRRNTARSIGEILASPDNPNDNQPASSYTRSLLKDKVSTQVLKDFAQMVSQHQFRQSPTMKTEAVD